MKILITGGSGFIGSHLADCFLQAGFQVGLLDRQPPKEVLPPAVSYYQVDITKPGLEAVIGDFKPDIIDHHAALINVAAAFEEPVVYTQTNVLGTIKLLELAKKYQVKHFIFASSVAVYGVLKTLPVEEDNQLHPDSFYGLDKYLGELYVKLYKPYFKTTILRYANVYGPRQNTSAEGGVVAIFSKLIASNQRPTINGSGQQTRDFVFVKDVSRANLLAVEQAVTGTYQVGTQTQTSIKALAERLIDIAGKPIQPDYGPLRVGDVDRVELSYKQLQERCGWKPQHSLDEGLKLTYDYFKANA